MDSRPTGPSAISLDDRNREKPLEAVKLNEDADLSKICLDDSAQSQLKDRYTDASTSNRSFDSADPCIHPASPSNKPIPFPSLHPSSDFPPNLPHHNSVSLSRSPATSDEYSWEWGGFPQRTQIRMEYTLSDTTPVKTAHSTQNDEQLVVSQVGEFHRSKSLPPEFELDVTEGVASTSRQSNEQLSGRELHSDVETGFDHDSSMLDRESKSWARWWRRDNKHPRRVDIRSERPPLQNAASAPLPPSFSGRRPKMRYAKTLRLTSEQLVSITRFFLCH